MQMIEQNGDRKSAEQSPNESRFPVPLIKRGSHQQEQLVCQTTHLRPRRVHNRQLGKFYFVINMRISIAASQKFTSIRTTDAVDTNLVTTKGMEHTAE